MPELTPEQLALIKKQHDSLQRIAMQILALPKEQRDEAYAAARRSFEAASEKFDSNKGRSRKLVDLNMERLRTIVAEIEASGGGQGGTA